MTWRGAAGDCRHHRARNGERGHCRWHRERVPFIMMSGGVDPVDAVTGKQQLFDHRAIFGPASTERPAASDGTVAAPVDTAAAASRKTGPDGDGHHKGESVLAVARLRWRSAAGCRRKENG